MSNTALEQENEQSKQPVQVLIRLWHARSNPHADAKQETSLRARALVEDILASSLDSTTSEATEDCMYASGLNNLSRTLAASRALQEAFDGFRAAVPSGKTTVSLVLDAPLSGKSGAALTGPSMELNSLLEVARPGQVLITQSFYKRIESCQSLQLRSFPPRAGAYEWLWTGSERLDQLQSDPAFRPTLVGEPRIAPISPVVAKTPPGASAVPPRSTIQSSFATSKRSLAWNRPAFRWIAAVVLVAVGIAGGLTWYLPQRNKPHRTFRPPVLPKSVTSEIYQPRSEILPGKLVLLPFPLPELPTQPTPKPPPQSRACSIEGQTTQYLAMARNNRNRGDFDAAIREYSQVLVCEPGNREARQGLNQAQQDKLDRVQ